MNNICGISFRSIKYYKNIRNFKYWLFRFAQIVIHPGFGKQKGGNGGKVKTLLQNLVRHMQQVWQANGDAGEGSERTSLHIYTQAHRTLLDTRSAMLLQLV